jgi:hypothetical protein
VQRAEEETIANKLDTIILLVPVALAENNEGQKEQIRVLVLAGLTPARIAGILGTTGHNVNVAIAKMRKAKRLPARR